MPKPTILSMTAKMIAMSATIKKSLFKKEKCLSITFPPLLGYYQTKDRYFVQTIYHEVEGSQADNDNRLLQKPVDKAAPNV